MNAAVAGLLAGLLLAGFARPRWWLSLVPVAIAVAVGTYRLTLPRSASADAVAFLGIVLLTVVMEGSLVVGAVARSSFEGSQSRPLRAKAALAAARSIGLIGLAFVGAAVMVSRAAGGLAMIMSLVAVGVVLDRARRAHVRRGGARPRINPVRRRTPVATRAPRVPPGRRGASRRPGYGRRVSR